MPAPPLMAVSATIATVGHITSRSKTPSAPPKLEFTHRSVALAIAATRFGRDGQRPLQTGGVPQATVVPSFEVVEYTTLEWVDLFNYRRQSEPFGNIPAAEAQEQRNAAADTIDMTAGLATYDLRQTQGGSY